MESNYSNKYSCKHKIKTSFFSSNLSKMLPFSKTFPTRTKWISYSFIILFTFIFLLKFPLKSNLITIHSTTIAPLTSHLFSLATNFTSPVPSVTITAQNSPAFAIANEAEYRAPSPSPGTRVENGSSLVSAPSLGSSCDMFDGTWVNDDSGPIYPPGSCPFVGESFNCYKSGRPDFGYLNYRWQPYDCDIPRFDGKEFMEMLRGKKMVFVGDSLNRNMWESLICSLGTFNVQGMRFLKRDGFSFEIKDYECSIVMITAPFIVKHWKNSGSKAIQTPIEKLRLDQIHDTVSKYYDADFLIFNTGQWWNPARTKGGENFFQEGDVLVHKKMDLEVAYTKALNTWADWIDNNVNKNKTKVFFVGLTAVHYKGGEWYSNGTCHKEREPIKDTESIQGQVLTPYRPWVMRTPELVISKMKTPVIYLNITRLTEYRKDGHPSRYRRPGSKWHPGVPQDCMHWCLPGVPESWNQLLYASLLSSFEG